MPGPTTIFPAPQFAPATVNDTRGSDNLTALLGVDDTGKLAMLGGFGVAALQYYEVEPGVRAWRLITGLKPVPQVGQVSLQSPVGAVFCTPKLVGPSVPGVTNIVVDVYLDSPRGPVDPQDVLGSPGGFVFVHIGPAGTTQLVATLAPPP